MNHIGMAMIVLGPFGLLLAAGNLDGGIALPLKEHLALITTCVGIGMWVSKKVTSLEEAHVRFADRQAENIARLDSFDRRLLGFDEQISTNHNIIMDRLDRFDERILECERKSP